MPESLPPRIWPADDGRLPAAHRRWASPDGKGRRQYVSGSELLGVLEAIQLFVPKLARSDATHVLASFSVVDSVPEPPGRGSDLEIAGPVEVVHGVVDGEL